ncbi:MAG: hypothetical protein ABJA64_02725 [Candidatus Saccharibacteria bacterium]
MTEPTMTSVALPTSVWYVALTSDRQVFPIKFDGSGFVIPDQDINCTFTFDTTSWEIIAKRPKVENGNVLWETKLFAKLIGLEKMTCFPNMNRIIDQIASYVDKTIRVDDKLFKLKILKKNDHTGGFFSVLEVNIDGSLVSDQFHEIRFDDYKMYIGIDGQWVERSFSLVNL